MATNRSARLTRAYTDAERQAVLEAHLVDGLTMAETERRAIAGTLRPDLGPFGRPRFVYHVIAGGREGFEARNETALDSGASAELKRLTRLALAKARELDKDSDPAEIARRAKALADTHRALRGAAGQTKTQRKPTQSDSALVQTSESTAQRAADVLAQLTALAQDRKTPPAEPYSQGQSQGRARGPVASPAS